VPHPDADHGAATPSDDLLTYEEAAIHLHLSRGRIADLVSKGILHPVKLPGSRHKFLRRPELDWYGRRRQGSAEPNPLGDASLRAEPLSGASAALPDLAAFSRASPDVPPLPGGSPELYGVVAAAILLIVLRWLVERVPSGASERKQGDAALVEQIRTLRTNEAGRAVLAGLASQIAGVLARGDTSLTAPDRAQFSELLSLLIAPSTPTTSPPPVQNTSEASTEGTNPPTRRSL
jgi:hypothetical protein